MIVKKGGIKGWWQASLDLETTPTEFQVRLDPPTIRDMTFQDAADYTAQCMAERYDNLYLAMGGGVDSEFVGEVFVRNGVKFTPIVATFPESQNYDYYAAFHWCDEHGVEPREVKFTQNDRRSLDNLVTMIRQYQRFTPRSVLMMQLYTEVNNLHGHIVHGDPQLADPHSGNMTGNYYEPAGDEFSCDWFSLAMYDQTALHPGPFFFYTPEIVWAYVRELDTKVNAYTAKHRLYRTVPYRMRTLPPLGFDLETLDAMRSMFKITHQETRATHSWSRPELHNFLKSKLG